MSEENDIGPEEHYRSFHHDVWSRLPGWVRAFVAIGVVWMAGWTGALVAAEYAGVPNKLSEHAQRITRLEVTAESSAERADRIFIYLACRLDEMANAAPGTTAGAGRCGLVLDDETRSILRELRTN